MTMNHLDGHLVCITPLIIYRVTAVMEVKRDIIGSIAASQIGRAVILVIIYIEIFKTDVLVFISNGGQERHYW
jgi:hypothetical protein